MEPPPISIFVRTRAYVVDVRRIRKLAQLGLAALGVADKDLSISIVNSAEIRRLNRDFRGKDKATDVLSFPQLEFARPLLPEAVPSTASKRHKVAKQRPPVALGDLVISVPQAAANARSIGQSLDREVAFLIVHGLLHLCGHDHIRKKDERVMLAAQRVLMDVFEAKSKPLWQGCVRGRLRRVAQ